MADVVSICNQALGNCGISQFINLITEQSNEAIICNVYYEGARDRVLAEIPWNFARKTVTLQDIGTPPKRWGYRFRYPIDCLQILYVEDETTDYEVVADTDNEALAICCNIPNPELIYTARIEQTRLYSPLFIEALGWSLAIDIATPLSVNAGLIQGLGNAYNTALSKAAALNLNEFRKTDTRTTDLLAARY